MILIDNVSKKFGALTALNQVSLELKGGKSYALIGPNGSGKTTLIKSMLGLVVPTTGNILFENVSILNNWKYREKIGYMPQIGRYPENMRIGQLFEMMKNIRKGNPKVDEELIDAFKLYKIFDKPMHALSGGTRQKVSAALAFLFHAPVLILDEPTAGLDPVSVEILKEKIIHEKRMGKLLVITSHILSDLDEIATEMVYMFEGRVQYSNSIETLKRETNESKLNKAIATLIRQRELLESVTE
ncbi:MAG: ABC transporter [Bacteroidota bacterium]|nr:MAG: ABC transporter [Bacteroidetes bacterium OLB12]GIL21850.1 MAG: ABC transporter [Bacteroidota bacterium]HNR73462.1 ABC transporter ATP-binding protein [Cyclobacteriaceae bacterium]HNU41878.1 ABC transporter ATP-binding protein [Cyclobacteriaceae bacterium]